MDSGDGCTMGIYLIPLTGRLKIVNFTQLFKNREREQEVEWMILYISQPRALNARQHL